MKSVKEITICLGSSCFARGNKSMPKYIQSYLKDKGLTNVVKLKGHHCTNNCKNGPVLVVDKKTYLNVTAENIKDILDNYFE